MGESLTGFVRAIILVMVAVSSLVMFLNLAFFFPWYLTIVETGFTVSQMIATDNYLRFEYYDDVKEKLKDYPIFNMRQDEIEITAIHINEYRTAIENEEQFEKHEIDPLCYYKLDIYDTGKPYVQMGNPVEITVYAAFPLQMRLFGKDIRYWFPDIPDITVAYTMTTTTTKHYKDLEYEYTGTNYYGSDDDEFIDW